MTRQRYHNPPSVASRRWAHRVGVLTLAAIALTSTQGYAEVPASEKVRLPTAKELEAPVESIRGLPVLVPIKSGVKTKKELRASLTEKIDTQVKPEEIEGEAAMLVRLGLMPAGLDYKQIILDLLTEQIAGYYDHERAELFLIDGLDPAIFGPATAHEIFHAIQDQHFTLESVQPPKEGLAGSSKNADRALARSALIEGDATVLMIDYQLRSSGMASMLGGRSWVDIPLMANATTNDLDGLMSSMSGESPALANAPKMVQKQLAFPYIGGLVFVQKLRTGRTWADINRIYLDPPNSTEQILHPERYRERDKPTLVNFDASRTATLMLGESAKVIHETVMGELGLKVWLAETFDTNPKVAKAAAGWDGDRLFIVRGGDRDVAVLASVWDSTDDAHEFAAALTASLKTRYPDGQLANHKGRHGAMACITVDGEKHIVERWGDWVVYIGGAPEADSANLGAVRKQIWGSREAGDYPPTRTAGRRWPAPPTEAR